MRIGKPNTGSSPAAPPTIQQTQARNGALTDNEPAPALGPARPHSEAAVRLLPVGRQPVLPPQQRPHPRSRQSASSVLPATQSPRHNSAHTGFAEVGAAPR